MVVEAVSQTNYHLIAKKINRFNLTIGYFKGYGGDRGGGYRGGGGGSGPPASEPRTGQLITFQMYFLYKILTVIIIQCD